METREDIVNILQERLTSMEKALVDCPADQFVIMLDDNICVYAKWHAGRPLEGTVRAADALSANVLPEMQARYWANSFRNGNGNIGKAVQRRVAIERNRDTVAETLRIVNQTC